MENFAVKSESFALYEAFKTDVEKIGYSYNAVFGWDSEDVKDSFCRKRMDSSNCLYFSDKWNSVAFPLSFAFSNSGDAKSFHLEFQYGEALAFAKEVWEKEHTVKFSFSGTCCLGIDNKLDISAMRVPSNNPPYICPLVTNFYTVTNPVVPTPKFKVGEWVRDITNGEAYKVLSLCVFDGIQSYETVKGGYIFENLLEKWLPQKGEYCFGTTPSSDWVFISKGKSHIGLFLAALAVASKDMYFPKGGNSDYIVNDEFLMQNLRPATPTEIALLDSKLSEKGKRFDKEKCKLVDIYKPKFAKGDIVKEIYDGKIGIVTIPAIDHRVCNVVKLSDREDGFWSDNQLIKIGHSL